MKDYTQWEGFEGRIWKEEVNVRDFIQKNYTPYDGDESFLAGPTDATNKLWGALQKLQKEERAKGGVLDMETDVVSSLTSYGPGYIDENLKDLEQIVGIQTDKPLKRAFMPYGQSSTRFSLSTPAPTTRLSLTPTPPRCGKPATATSSPACPTPTAAAGSWAITAAWPCTASIT